MNIPGSRKYSTVLNEDGQWQKIKAEDGQEDSLGSSPMQLVMEEEVIEIFEDDEADEEEAGRKVSYIKTTNSCKRPAAPVRDTGEAVALYAPTLTSICSRSSEEEERLRKKPTLEERLKAGSFLAEITARQGAILDRLKQIEDKVFLLKILLLMLLMLFMLILIILLLNHTSADFQVSHYPLDPYPPGQNFPSLPGVSRWQG